MTPHQGDVVVGERFREIAYLRQGEIDARNRGYSPYSSETWRAWEYWANKAGCSHMLSKPEHAHPHKKS